MKMAQAHTVKVVDQIHVSPPLGSVPLTTVPLTFFDTAWLFCGPVQRVLFYEFPYPTLDFTETVLPHLKHSLSLTLQHFFPLAGNLTCPRPPEEPYILFREGDSIPITIAESDGVFNHLISNHPRDVRAFHSLVPKLPIQNVSSNNTDVVPIMAIQITVFPNSGISIGLTFSHVATDGRSFHHFMKFWASVNRSSQGGGGEDLTFLDKRPPLPYRNRDVIKDPNGLSSIFLKKCRSWENNNSAPVVPVDDVRMTLVINRAQVEKLKHFVMTNSPGSNELRISTFVVSCALTWVNLVKLQASNEIKGQSRDDTLCHLIALGDCRGRFDDFPIPSTYFGNCVAMIFVSVQRNELMREDGVAVAAEAIGRKFSEFEKGPLIGAEKWLSDSKEKMREEFVVVAGSPKLLVYDTDFGWGRPKKTEVVHIKAYTFFSIGECRDDEGGVEIGLVIGRDKLETFNAIFN